MLKRDHAIFVRMVVLCLLTVALFFGYAAYRRLFLSPPDERVHTNPGEFHHMQALLYAIQPASALFHPSAGWRHACPAGRVSHPKRLEEDIGELNSRLAKLAAGAAPFLPRVYRLDARRWLDKAATLPGGCNRAANTLDELLWADRSARIEKHRLTRLEWRDRVRKSQWKWGHEVYVATRQTDFARANPWRSLPGCVLLASSPRGGHATAQAALSGVIRVSGFSRVTACQGVLAKDRQGEAATLNVASPDVPRNLALLVRDLAVWRDPGSDVYRKLIGDSNMIPMPGGKDKPVGLNVLFTFDPAMQRIVQFIAECYAGNVGACKESGMGNPGREMKEGARVRQVGVAVIDIPSGEVRVAASAESPCFRDDVSGIGPRPGDCPNLGAAARDYYRKNGDALLNHALFTIAPPGSTVKPIMATGFLRDPRFHKSNAELIDRIKHSNSKIFLDWMFCRAGEGRGAFSRQCRRPALIQSAAHALGWNQGCENGTWCGFLDILFGRPSYAVPAGFPTAGQISGAHFNPASRNIVLGRILATSRGGRLVDMSPSELQPDTVKLRRCAEAGWRGGAKVCQKNGLAPVSEGYGQGSARASPIGVAAMMAQLAASAEYGKPVRYPHVVRALLNANGQPDPAGNPARWGLPIKPAGIKQGRAKRILRALEHTDRRGGTASGGCKKVFGHYCGDIGVAGKTGTTSFGAKYSRLAGFRRAWRFYQTALNEYRKCAARARTPAERTRCRPPGAPPRPWRWYAGVFKSDPGSKYYDKAFAVLVERNWTKTGKIDELGGEDRNSPAIEIGFHLIKAIRKAGKSRRER